MVPTGRRVTLVTLALLQGSASLMIRPAKVSDMRLIRRALWAERMNPLFVEQRNFVTAREADGELVGAAQLRPLDGASYELASLFVLPEHRRRGIGGALVRECLGRAPGAQLRGSAVSKSAADVYLLTLATCAGFYERFGFGVVSKSASVLPLTLAVECALGQLVR